MRAGTTGVHNPFRNSLVIEVEDLFSQDEIFEQGRAPSASFERILVVADADALICGQSGLGGFFRFRGVLMRFTAVSDGRFESRGFCHVIILVVQEHMIDFNIVA